MATFARKLSLVRRTAPHFVADALIDGKIARFDSAALRGRYAALLFYPLDFTFVCPTEIAAFSRRQRDFDRLECAVVGVSVDSVYTHAAFAQSPSSLRGLSGSLGAVPAGNGATKGPDARLIPLVADIKKEISRAYSVLDEDAGYALRALVLIDRAGIVRHHAVSDAQLGRSVDEAIRLLSALRHVDETPGEVCPVNWSPGEPTISTK